MRGIGLKGSWYGILTATSGGVAAILLFALMIITCVDVGGRYFFNAPLIGAFEMTQIAMALLIYASLPIVTVTDEHVSVDLLDSVLPTRWRRLHRLLLKVICVGVLLLVAWALWRKAESVAASGIYTDSLRIPMAPAAYFMSFISFLTAALLLLIDGTGLKQTPNDGTRGQEGREQ